MALLILALLPRILRLWSLMLLLVWLIFCMVLIKVVPMPRPIDGDTLKWGGWARVTLVTTRGGCHPRERLRRCRQCGWGFVRGVLSARRCGTRSSPSWCGWVSWPRG